MLSINQLRDKWNNNSEEYKTKEVGSGVHSFIKDVFASANLFNLKETAAKTTESGTFVHDTESGKRGRPDFVLYINSDIAIPVEAKCYTRIDEGVAQLRRYQLDYNKQYGILTDGFEWRFYRASSYRKFTIPEMLEHCGDFLAFWTDYIKTENYYIEIFNSVEQQNIFKDTIDLNDSANRTIFFDDTTRLIEKFMVKMQVLGVWGEIKSKEEDKKAIETSYTYLIQFILFKVIVDSGLTSFTNWYNQLFQKLKKFVLDPDLYQSILDNIKQIADYVSTHIYKPFKDEQARINKKVFSQFRTNVTLDDIAPWLDIIVFINKYNFGNLRNEIFGFIYENYLKELYGDKNKGQYFTDPEVVNLMLEEMGYTPEILKKQQDKLSIIDASCGAGTFLYSAVDRIIGAFAEKGTQEESKLVEDSVIIAAQFYALDRQKFVEKISKVKRETIEKVENGMMFVLGINR
jgi:hypothetical protein